MFYVLNLTTNYGANIQKTFNNYFNLKDYESKMRDSVEVYTSEITCFDNEQEYKKLLDEQLKQALNSERNK
jgi:hypothetical protein